MDNLCYLCLCLSFFLVLSLQPCSHLLGKGSPLGLFVCEVLLYFCQSPLKSPGSGVELDCIDSLSLPSYLLYCLLQAKACAQSTG